MRCNFPALALALLIASGAIASFAADAFVSAEATIQGGVSANLDVDEVTAGYVHVKYSATLDSSRKAYFQFNLAGLAPNTNAPATFTVKFTVSNKQRVQLWALNQPYVTFDPNITWNTAQANDVASNELFTNGSFTATAVGTNLIVPISGVAPCTFTLPRLGDILFSDRVTFVLAGVSDAVNNGGGLRMQRANAVLTYSLADSNPPPATNTTHYDVYLAAGQSNMDGRGSANELTGNLASWSGPQSDVRIYYANPANLDPVNPTYHTGWQVLAPGFSVPPGFSDVLPSTKFGPELAFARTVADANTNRHVAVIKVSRGGTSLSSDWKPATGYMYATLTNIARRALQALTNTGAQYTLRGVIWHQGESDGTSSTSTYQTRLTEFISAVRKDFGVTNLPFVIGELATNRSDTVRQAQYNCAAVIPYVGIAVSSNLATLAPDDPHFTTPGALIMGQRMAAALEVPQVAFTSVSRIAGDCVLTASGLALSPCRLLAATNLALPPSQWMIVATNSFDGSGAVKFTNAASAASLQKFYAIGAD